MWLFNVISTSFCFQSHFSPSSDVSLIHFSTVPVSSTLSIQLTPATFLNFSLYIIWYIFIGRFVPLRHKSITTKISHDIKINIIQFGFFNTFLWQGLRYILNFFQVENIQIHALKKYYNSLKWLTFWKIKNTFHL